MWRLIILAIPAIMWLHGSGTSSALIENFQLDKQNEVVTFDVKPVSTKPIRAWMLRELEETECGTE